MLEKELQKHVQDYLIKKGIYFFHVPRLRKGNRDQLSGIFDLMCYCDKGHFCIELKHPDKKLMLRKKQEEFADILLKAKIPYLISNNYDEIINFIDVIIGE